MNIFQMNADRRCVFWDVIEKQWNTAGCKYYENEVNTKLF